MRPKSFIVALALTMSGATSAQSREMVCPPTVDNRISQSLHIDPFDFAWSSDWNITPGSQAKNESQSRYCICNEVHNSSSRALYYSWPVANQDDEGLSPQKSDWVCIHAYGYSNPPSHGLLYYGRSGAATYTQVWKGLTQHSIEGGSLVETTDLLLRPLSHRAIEVTSEFQGSDEKEAVPSILITAEFHSTIPRKKQYFLFVPLPRKSENVDSYLSLTSEVSRIVGGYSIRNIVRNLHPKMAIFARLSRLSGVPLNLEGGVGVTGLEMKEQIIEREEARGPRVEEEANAGSPVPAGGQLASGRSSASIWGFLRRHLWPTPETPPTKNFYQEIVAEDHVLTTPVRPIIVSEVIAIETPRRAAATKFEVPVWAMQANEKSGH